MIEFPPEDLNHSQAALLESTSPYVLMAGGFGSGKSSAAIMKALQLKGENGNLPGLLMAQSYGELYTNIVDPMLELLEESLPKRLRPWVEGRGGSKPCLRFPDGCKVHLRSAESPKSYAGANVAWLVGDEVRYWDKNAYDIAIARVRLKHAPRRQRVFTSTPAMNWMYNEFATGRAMRELIRAPTTENAHNLAEEYIPGLRASYSKRMQRALLEGEFTILEGAVYEDFDPYVNGSPWIVEDGPLNGSDAHMLRRYLESRRVFLAVDPGYRKSSWLWIVEHKPLEWIVFDQIQGDHATVARCAELVNLRKHPIDEIWCDPAADNTEGTTGIDAVSALRMLTCRNTAPIRMIGGRYRDVAFGVDKTRVLLGGAHGQPIRLRFTRKLEQMERGKERGLIRSLSSYSYPEVKDRRAVLDQPLKDGVYDHDNDALRYWAIGRWLCEPVLRSMDPTLLKSTDPGYRTAA